MVFKVGFGFTEFPVAVVHWPLIAHALITKGEETQL